MRAVIANRDAAITRGVALLLEKYSGVEVVGEVTRVADVVPEVTRLQPNVLLLGPRLGFRNLRRLIEVVRDAAPHTAVVILTKDRNAEQLRDAIQGGATAYVSVRTAPEELARTVLLAAQGQVLISGAPGVNGDRSFASESHSEYALQDHPPLSERETEVLDQLIRGATNSEIAKALFITNNTVKVHVRNILRKLGVRNRQQAAVLALQEGLGHVTPPPTATPVPEFPMASKAEARVQRPR